MMWIGLGGGAGVGARRILLHSSGLRIMPLQNFMAWNDTLVSLPKRFCKSCNAPKLLDFGKNCGKPLAGLSSRAAPIKAPNGSKRPIQQPDDVNAFHPRRRAELTADALSPFA